LIYNKNATLEATVTLDGGSLANKVEPFSGPRVPPKLNAKRLGVNISTPATQVVLHTLIVPAQLPSDVPPA
jgi:hypothetical protein